MTADTIEPRVLLVNMPFASLAVPALSSSMLQARLRADGILCDTRHFGFLLARHIDPNVIERLTRSGPLIGESLFADALYGDAAPHGGAALVDHLCDVYLWARQDAERLLDLRRACVAFIEECLASIELDRYDIVGFSSMFDQNLASLALARRIKNAKPTMKIVFGGANWLGEMGAAQLELFDFVDAACVGEGDMVVTDLVRRLHRGQDLSTVPGIVYRHASGASITTRPVELVRDMDVLPRVDYSDWLADREAFVATGRAKDLLPPTLLFESSRGCWWGERSHCTFCGLNGEGLAYRLKSPDRVLSELIELRDRFGIDRFMATDTILDMRYFRSLLPSLAALDPPLLVFYEVKANLSFDQVRGLAAAGVLEIQPGIESLADDVLVAMRKGTTLVQNVQLLKWCCEFGINPHWNFLYGFPGETNDEYRELVPIIDAIRWLRAPGAFQPVIFQRFSPFHTSCAALGLANMRHNPLYRLLYRADEERLDRLAYYFDADYAESDRTAETHIASIKGDVEAWMNVGDPGGVWMQIADDGDRRGQLRVAVMDDRRSTGQTCRWDFAGWRAVAYTALERAHSFAQLLLVLSETEAVDAAALTRFLEWCVRNRLMIEYRGRFLALAVHSPARTSRDDPAAIIATRFARRDPTLRERIPVAVAS